MTCSLRPSLVVHFAKLGYPTLIGHISLYGKEYSVFVTINFISLKLIIATNHLPLVY